MKNKSNVRRYEREFGSFEIDIYRGKCVDGLDRGKIWEVALAKEDQEGIDSYKAQRYIYLQIFDQIFTEDLVEYGINWDWYFSTFGVEFVVKTPKKQYRLVVDAEGTFIFST